MNKTLAKGIAIILLIILSITTIFFLWHSSIITFSVFQKRINHNIIDHTTGEEYTPVRKYRYVLSLKIDSLIYANNPGKALIYIDSILPNYKAEKHIHFQKGLSLTMIDSFELAIVSFDEALKLNHGTFLRALHYKYVCLLELERYDEALEVLQKAVKVNSDYKIEIAEVYELKKDYQSSLEYYKMMLDEWEKDENAGSMYNYIQELKMKIKELEEK